MNGTRVVLCPFRARDVVAADSQSFALGWRVRAPLALRGGKSFLFPSVSSLALSLRSNPGLWHGFALMEVPHVRT